MSDAARRPTSGPPWAWRLLVRAVRLFLRLVFGWRVRVQQAETPPRADQPLVVVCNHTSTIDLLLVADTVWRDLGQWVQPLVKAELLAVPVIGRLARRAGAIPVGRDEADQREVAYGAAVDRLQEGGTIMIAPEGTVTHDGSLLPLRQGAARLALEAGADVLVVTHFGAQRGFSPIVRAPQRRVVVTMAMDVLTPLADEDAAMLTGRIAATLLDRSDELRAAYPQADATAPWWPPYRAPASPTATARKSLERYQASMSEAIERARERMAQLAEEHEVEQRVADLRERAHEVAEDLGERTRARAESLAEQAQQRMEQLADQARERTPGLAERWAGSDAESDDAESDDAESSDAESDDAESDAAAPDDAESEQEAADDAGPDDAR